MNKVKITFDKELAFEYGAESLQACALSFLSWSLPMQNLKSTVRPCGSL